MKERTLTGVHKGEQILCGYHEDGRPYLVTVWDGMLLLAINKLPNPYIPEWQGGYVVGDRYWKRIPHNFVKNPLNCVCYEDTLMTYRLHRSWPYRKKKVVALVKRAWNSVVDWAKGWTG